MLGKKKTIVFLVRFELSGLSYVRGFHIIDYY